jgi:ubiquitin-protein ligase
MSIRNSRVTRDFSGLKKMLKNSSIVQLKPFNPKKKIIDHLAITTKGPKGTAYAGGLFKLEMRFPVQYPKQPPFVRLHTPIKMNEEGKKIK